MKMTGNASGFPAAQPLLGKLAQTARWGREADLPRAYFAPASTAFNSRSCCWLARLVV
jgi:hypothetical protein